MGVHVNQLDVCCPVLGVEKFGTLLSQAITLLNEAKLRFNGHTHPATNTAPDSTLITAAVVDTVNSIADMNVLCELGKASFGTEINKMVTLANELRADFNSHGHTAIATAPTEQLAAVNMAALSASDKQVMNTVCTSFGDPQIGSRVEAVITLLTELRADYNGHVHPTLITNPPDLSIASADVQVLN